MLCAILPGGTLSVWLSILALPPAVAGLPDTQVLFAAVIAEVDQDGDGAIDLAEYAAVAGASGFQATDLDGSGRIDAAELATYTRVTPIGPGERSVVSVAVTVSVPQPVPARPPWALAVAVAAVVFLGGLLIRRPRPRRRRRRRGRGRRR